MKEGKKNSKSEVKKESKPEGKKNGSTCRCLAAPEFKLK